MYKNVTLNSISSDASLKAGVQHGDLRALLNYFSDKRFWVGGKPLNQDEFNTAITPAANGEDDPVYFPDFIYPEFASSNPDAIQYYVDKSPFFYRSGFLKSFDFNSDKNTFETIQDRNAHVALIQRFFGDNNMFFAKTPLAAKNDEVVASAICLISLTGIVSEGIGVDDWLNKIPCLDSMLCGMVTVFNMLKQNDLFCEVDRIAKHLMETSYAQWSDSDFSEQDFGQDFVDLMNSIREQSC